MILSIDRVHTLIAPKELAEGRVKAADCLESLYRKSGKGSDFLGWLSLPSETTTTELKAIQATADLLIQSSDVVVVVGIGGSYLGAEAVIDALSHSFIQNMKFPKIVFAGQNICEDYASELLELLEQKKRISCIVISKSGTTTEPAIAFRLVRQLIEQRHGKQEAAKRIVAITDKKQGALRQMAAKNGYATFTIADDIGGRFSVLTAVGLLPVAVAGFDIEALLEGAKEMERATEPTIPIENNSAATYAVVRNLLYQKGKKVEILANFNPKLYAIGEWWKQLYGESEGKEGKGIFPATVNFTTDLHSMGQYIQDGERMLFETVLSVTKPARMLAVPLAEEDYDGLNYLAGRRLSEVNKMAELGTVLAHTDGSVPNIRIELPEINEYNIGKLLYFFEKACGISGYLLGVNPFDQPGVEEYKRNMFALLGKAGYEKEGEVLRKRL